MAALRHLGFLKLGSFNFRPVRRCGRFCKMAAVRHLGFLTSFCQILCRSVKQLRLYGGFLFFKDGGQPPSDVLKVGNIRCQVASEG